MPASPLTQLRRLLQVQLRSVRQVVILHDDEWHSDECHLLLIAKWLYYEKRVRRMLSGEVVCYPTHPHVLPHILCRFRRFLTTHNFISIKLMRWAANHLTN